MFSRIFIRRKHLTRNSIQTKKIGESLAERFLKHKTPKQKALILGLEGDLGGGKTTFLQGFAKGLGIKEKILSPTFVIMKKFNLKLSTGDFQMFYHFDCYRLRIAKEILDLNFEKIINNPNNIVAIEWSDRISKIMPLETIFLRFKFVNQNNREITIDNLDQ